MTPKRMIKLESIKRDMSDRYHERMSRLYTNEVKKVIRWFMEKYPKRTIKWVSGMSTCFWVLDDEILDWSCLDVHYVPTSVVDYGDGVKHRFGGEHVWRESVPDRRALRLMPLWNLYQSINDVTHVLGGLVDTGDIDMEDVR